MLSQKVSNIRTFVYNYIKNIVSSLIIEMVHGKKFIFFFCNLQFPYVNSKLYYCTYTVAV